MRRKRLSLILEMKGNAPEEKEEDEENTEKAEEVE